MLRKAILGIGMFVVGFVLGTILGFGNGVEYQKDKHAKQRADPGFDPSQETQTVHIDLENQIE